jgi:hypothetical protein
MSSVPEMTSVLGSSTVCSPLDSHVEPTPRSI